MNLATLRDVSLIWLTLLALIAVLPIGAVFFFVVRGMVRLRQLTKQYVPLAQQKARQAADVTGQVSQKVAAPVIGLRARAAQAHGIRKAAFRRKRV